MNRFAHILNPTNRFAGIMPEELEAPVSVMPTEEPSPDEQEFIKGHPSYGFHRYGIRPPSAQSILAKRPSASPLAIPSQEEWEPVSELPPRRFPSGEPVPEMRTLEPDWGKIRIADIESEKEFLARNPTLQAKQLFKQEYAGHQAEMMARSQDFLGISEFLSRKGIHPVELWTKVFTGLDVTGFDAAEKEAIREIVAEGPLKQKLIYGLTRVPMIAAEFGLPAAAAGKLLKGINVTSKLAKLAKASIEVGVTFAAQEAIQLPRKGEILKERVAGVGESYITGGVLGPVGAGIPAVSKVAKIGKAAGITAGFGAATYAKTRNIDEAITTMVTVLGFQTFGGAKRWATTKYKQLIAGKSLEQTGPILNEVEAELKTDKTRAKKAFRETGRFPDDLIQKYAISEKAKVSVKGKEVRVTPEAPPAVAEEQIAKKPTITTKKPIKVAEEVVKPKPIKEKVDDSAERERILRVEREREELRRAVQKKVPSGEEIEAGRVLQEQERKQKLAPAGEIGRPVPVLPSQRERFRKLKQENLNLSDEEILELDVKETRILKVQFADSLKFGDIIEEPGPDKIINGKRVKTTIRYFVKIEFGEKILQQIDENDVEVERALTLNPEPGGLPALSNLSPDARVTGENLFPEKVAEPEKVTKPAGKVKEPELGGRLQFGHHNVPVFKVGDTLRMNTPDKKASVDVTELLRGNSLPSAKRTALGIGKGKIVFTKAEEGRKAKLPEEFQIKPTPPTVKEEKVSIVPESLQGRDPHEIHWGIVVNDKIVTSGTMVGMTEDHLAELAKGYNGKVVLADKTFSKKQEVGDIFGMTFEQIRAKQQKVKPEPTIDVFAEKGISNERAKELTGVTNPSLAQIRNAFIKMNATERAIVTETMEQELQEWRDEKKSLLKQRKEAFVPDKPIYTEKIRSITKVIEGRVARLERNKKAVFAPEPTIDVPGKIVSSREGGFDIFNSIAASEIVATTKAAIKGAKTVITDVPKTAKFYAGRAAYFIEKNYGEPGKELANDVREISFQSARRFSQQWDDIHGLLRKLSRPEQVALMKIGQGRRGIDPALRKKLKSYNAKMLEIMDRDMNEAAKVGFKRLIGGKWRDIKGSGKWTPQVLNEEGHDVMNRLAHRGMADPKVARAAEIMVEEGLAKTPLEAKQAMIDWNNLRTRGRVGYFESTRTLLPKYMIEFDPEKVLVHVLQKNAAMIEGARVFGGPGEKSVDFTKAKTLVEAIGAQYGQTHAEALKKWIRVEFGLANDMPEFASDVINTINRYETFARLGYRAPSALRNLTQGNVNLFTAPFSAHIKALDIFWLRPWRTEAIKLKKQIERSGAVVGQKELAEVERGPSAEARPIGLAMWMFGKAETSNHRRAALIARFSAEKHINDLSRYIKGGMLNRILTRIKYVSVNPEGYLRDMLKNRRFTKTLTDSEFNDMMKRPLTLDEVDRIMHRMSVDTQFIQNFATRPIPWRTNPFLRTVLKFKTFGIHQTRLIWTEAVKAALTGTFAPLLKYFLFSTLGGELWNIIRDLISGGDNSLLSTMKNRPEKRNAQEVAKLLLNDFVDGAGPGILMDITWGIGNFVIGPAGQTFVNIKEWMANVPKHPVTATKLLIRGEIAVSRDIEGLMARLDKTFINENNKKFEYVRWRNRSFEWRKKAGKFTEGKTDFWALTGRAAKEMFIGRPIYEKKLEYIYAAKQITFGDIDDAADYLTGRMKDLKKGGKTYTEIRKAIEGSMRANSPFGNIAQRDILTFLGQFNSTVRKEGLKLQADWIADYKKAIGKAFLYADIPSSGGRKKAKKKKR